MESDYGNTLKFLREVSNGCGILPSDESTLIQTLIAALSKDGQAHQFNIYGQGDEIHSHHMRGLSGNTMSNDSSVTQNLILVFLCVMMAGLASGLTQVMTFILE